MRGFSYRDRLALITGASSGIGAAFARRLASKGMHLLLTARSTERLESLARSLQAEHGVRVTTLALDLTAPEAPTLLCKRAGEHPDRPVHVLVNNAGFGEFGPFADQALEGLISMLRLNVEAGLRLAHALLPDMAERHAGGIINVASTAGFQPVPYMAAYSAGKAFVLSWSQALSEEYRLSGVRVVALCPGGTDTRFFERAGMSPRAMGRSLARPDDVVHAGLRALDRGRALAIPGLLNRALVEAQRLATRRIVSRVSAAIFKRRGI